MVIQRPLNREGDTRTRETFNKLQVKVWPTAYVTNHYVSEEDLENDEVEWARTADIFERQNRPGSRPITQSCILIYSITHENLQ